MAMPNHAQLVARVKALEDQIAALGTPTAAPAKEAGSDEDYRDFARQIVIASVLSRGPKVLAKRNFNGAIRPPEAADHAAEAHRIVEYMVALNSGTVRDWVEFTGAPRRSTPMDPPPPPAIDPTDDSVTERVTFARLQAELAGTVEE